MAASQVVAVPSWLDVKRASVVPQEHRVDHRSGRSFETCEISLRPRGSPRRGEFALLSLGPIKFQRLRSLSRFVCLGLDGARLPG